MVPLITTLLQWEFVHRENFMAIFTTLSVVVFTMRVVIYDIRSMAVIPTLSTSILFCNLCYILL